MRRLILILFLMLSLSFSFVSGKKILFIGDSITDGAWGNSGGGAKPSSERTLWDMNHIFGHGYMYLCAAHYLGCYPLQQYEFFNRGISGNTLEDLEKRWRDDVIKMDPDILSVLIGTNDVDVFLGSGEIDFDIEGWEKRYCGLLDAAFAMNSDLKLVLCAPFVANTGRMRRSENYREREVLIRKCAEAIERIAKKYKAIYLPFNIMFETLINKSDNTQETYWIWDGIHPTAAGHWQMADMWIRYADEYGIMK